MSQEPTDAGFAAVCGSDVATGKLRHGCYAIMREALQDDWSGAALPAHREGGLQVEYAEGHKPNAPLHISPSSVRRSMLTRSDIDKGSDLGKWDLADVKGSRLHRPAQDFVARSQFGCLPKLAHVGGRRGVLASGISVSTDAA